MTALGIDLIRDLAIPLGVDLQPDSGSGPGSSLVLDKISVPARAAYSCFHRLRGVYSGPVLRVRRDSDNAEWDIAFAGDFIDQAALLAFVGAGSGYVVRLYDQCGGGRDLVMTAAVSSQPRIVNLGVLETYPAGRPAMWFDGSNDRIHSLVGAGFSANPDITAGIACMWLDPGMPFSFGANVDTGTGSRMTLYRPGTGLTVICKEHKAASRNFTPVTDPAGLPQYYVMQHTAGGTTTSGVLRQNGVDLAGVGAGPDVPLVLGNDVIMLGSQASTSFWMQGHINAFMLFNAVLTGANLIALEEELALHTVLNSVPTLSLDRISIPATVAMSVTRRLRGAYAGPALRVRRSSDNAELDIGFVDNLLDQSALLGFVGVDSGFVVTLYDQSGNNRHVTQATAAAQPRIVNAGVLEVVPGGPATMSFDGIDDRLRRAVAGNTTGIAGSPNVTVGSALQMISTSAVAWAFGTATGTTGGMFGLHRSTASSPGTIKKTHYATDRNHALIAGPETDARYYVFQHTAGDNSHTGVVRQNGVSLVPGTTGGSASALVLTDSNLELGAQIGTNWLQGELNVFILFNAVLTGTDLATLEDELRAHTVDE